MTMAWKNLIPWGGTRFASAVAPPLPEKGYASFALHQHMNRLLDNVTRSFGSGFRFQTPFDWPGTWPHFEVSDNDKEITVVAELPGFEENDVEVWLDDGGLTLKGDKKEEKESSDNARSSKRKRRQFQRSLRLHSDVESSNVRTSLKNDVLTVTLAKRAHP
jgi:HSP20 family protein